MIGVHELELLAVLNESGAMPGLHSPPSTGHLISAHPSIHALRRSKFRIHGELRVLPSVLKHARTLCDRAGPSAVVLHQCSALLGAEDDISPPAWHDDARGTPSSSMCTSEAHRVGS